jgi:hypothetical protein
LNIINIECSGVKKEMKCRSCSYQFDPLKEGNARKRKCGMCCFGDSYSVRSKKEYDKNLLFYYD